MAPDISQIAGGQTCNLLRNDVQIGGACLFGNGSYPDINVIETSLTGDRGDTWTTKAYANEPWEERYVGKAHVTISITK